MTEQTTSDADELRRAIQQERDAQLQTRANLRGCKLSPALRERAQRHVRAQVAAGVAPKQLARDLGLSVGAVEHWLKSAAAPPTPRPDTTDAEEIRRQIAEARRGKTELRGQRLAEALRQRAQEHLRTRLAAGAKLQRIASELGVNVATLQQWMRPPPADGPVKLRPVRIIGPINNSVAELTGPRLVLPSGVQIVGLDVDQMTTLMKRLG